MQTYGSLSNKLRARLREIVREIHARGEYPSRGRVIAMLKHTMSVNENKERIAELERLGVPVQESAAARAGYAMLKQILNNPKTAEKR